MSETAHDVLLRAGISRYQVTQRGDHKVQITITTPFTTLMGVGHIRALSDLLIHHYLDKRRALA